MKRIVILLIICRYGICVDTTNSNSDATEDVIVNHILKKAMDLTERGFEIAKKDVVADKKSYGHHEEERAILGHCDVNKKCEKGQYCEGEYCLRCKSEGDHCDLNGECCEGAECQYGFCTKGAKAGDPGTYCDLAKDCKGKEVCCIHEMSINHHHSICKPMLDEHESCGPINLFHQEVMRAHMEPLCGPCKPGLSCKGVGILGRHSICLPETEE